MGRRSTFRAVAVALLLAALLFSGAQFARSAARNMAAPLAGLERLARRPPAPEPAPPALPSSEDLGLVMPDEAEVTADAAEAEKPANRVRAPGAPGATVLSANATLAFKEAHALQEGLRFEIQISSADLAVLSRYIRGSSDLSLENLPKMTKDLALSDLQRERIERWLTWKKESLEALGEQSSAQAVRGIEDATAEAVKAELDFFQGELFDKSRHEAAPQRASIRLVALEALNHVHLEAQQSKTQTRWAVQMLGEVVK